MCSLGIEPTTFCAADAVLYNWATQEHTVNNYNTLFLQVKSVFDELVWDINMLNEISITLKPTNQPAKK